MAQESRLKKSQKVALTDGQTVTIIGKFGEGGQGIVYKVRLDGTSEERALKWYFIENIKNRQEFYSNLVENIKKGSPSSSFIWPETLTEDINGTFGYIMRILPSEYKNFSRFLMAQESFATCQAMVNTALNIVVAFRELHNKGYNYQDLNDENFAIDPQTGDILICDNDNVMGHGQSSGILGKVRYMAPEIARGEKNPDKNTDRFSLSVILFMLLVGNHPLEGRETNVPALTNKHEKKFFGTEPVFIFDDQINNNPPVAGLHKNAIDFWPCLPSFIQTAFKKSFNQESLLHSKDRLLEEQWLHLLVQLKSSIVKCSRPDCGSDIFIESNFKTFCSNCKQNVSSVGYLKFVTSRCNMEITLPISEGIHLYEYHMNKTSGDYQTEAAVIIAKPGKFGLKNFSNYRWTVTSANGNVIIIPHGEVAVLAPGSKIDFGNENVVEVVRN